LFVLAGLRPLNARTKYLPARGTEKVPFCLVSVAKKWRGNIVEREVTVKHHTREELQNLGAVESTYPLALMSRDARLARWAELLDLVSDVRLSTLRETEYQPAIARRSLRADDSPISVAFKDPALRAAGLEGDTYGEAKRFFEMSDRQLHNATCYCRFGGTVTGAEAARHVRSVLGSRKSWFAQLCARLFG
jgi:hypothetical protein